MMLTITDIRDEATSIKSVEIRRQDGGRLPPFAAGDHIVIRLPNGLRRCYSLANDPTETHRYLLGVHLSPFSRGGSDLIHKGLHIGQTLDAGDPVSGFRLEAGAANVLLIAGGIGITPLLSMAHVLTRRHLPFSLHYCIGSRSQAAFANVLGSDTLRDHVVYHCSAEGRRLDLASLMQSAPRGTQVYCCGPSRLIEQAKIMVSQRPDMSFHSEFFQTSEDDIDDREGFICEIASSGTTVRVSKNETILSALRDNGVEVDSLCEVGTCGTCAVGLLDGVADHRDRYLLADERNSRIVLCVSRAKSGKLLLDL